MDRYKKANLRSQYLGIVGAMVLLAILSSSGPYVLSFGGTIPTTTICYNNSGK